MALMRKSTAAIFMTEMRPILSAIQPAVIAPAAAPEQRRGDGETEFGVADAEVLLDRVDRTVDHRAVVAEQQAAERGHRSDSDGSAARREVIVVGDR